MTRLPEAMPARRTRAVIDRNKAHCRDQTRAARIAASFAAHQASFASLGQARGPSTEVQ